MIRRATVFWLLAYLAAMTLVVGGLLILRQRTLTELNTPEARRQWQAWKQETSEKQQAAEPVRRRPVRSDEPPALILLRDHFAAIVATTVMICSFLFAFLAFVASGSLGGGGRKL
jgi:hypothetical protein